MKKNIIMGLITLLGILINAEASASDAPGVPKNFRVDISVGTTGQLFVSWDGSDGVAYYNLQSSQSKDSGYSQVTNCSGTAGNSYTHSPTIMRICRDNKLTVKATYYYKVQACGSDNNCSAFTAPFSNTPVSSNCTKDQMPSLQGMRPLKPIVLETKVVDPNAKFDRQLNQYAGYPTEGVTRQNLLVVKLPGSDETCDMEGISRAAENLGFDLICVNFENLEEQRTICQSDLDCFGNISQAKLDATGPCSTPNQPHCGIEPKTKRPYFLDNPADAVTMRITTMLQYLDANGYNANGTKWSSYLSGSEPNWKKIIIGGHSQGGDLGTYAAYKHSVARVFNLSAPPQTDLESGNMQVAANYFSENKATDIRSIYGFVSVNDPLYGMNVYSAVWSKLGFTPENNDAEVKLNVAGEAKGLNCNSGVPSHNFSTSALISHPGAGHADPLYQWNEDVWKFMFLD